MKNKSIFQFIKVLKKLKIKDQVRNIVIASSQDDINDETVQTSLGVDIAFLIIENMDLAEDEVCLLMEDALGINDFKEHDFMETIELIKKEFSGEGIKNFFQSVSALMK